MPRPNVLVFFTDQQRWDSTGVHGNPLELTPNFDRVARAGTDVHHSFTCQPVCGPARACLQTGLYQNRTGCYRNAIPLPRGARTLAHHFNDAGYHTGYIGKWHLAEPAADRGPVPVDQRGGYRHWLAANALEFTSDAYRTRLFDADNRPVDLPGYRADALTDAAIRFVDDRVRAREPFFLFVSYLEPHHQNHLDDYPPPAGYRERYTGRWTPPDLAALGGSAPQHLSGYWGMVKRLDECFGRMLDALASLGLRDDTIVLFTSDHGCHFKTRNAEYKRSCHESSIRVPTLLAGPGFDGGGQLQQLVSLIDLPPTLLDAAGLPVPPEMQGRSIVPLAQRRAGAWDAWPDDVFVQISESHVGRAVRTRRWKYGVGAPDKDGWRDAASDRYVEQFLYDLACDPYELTNLIGFESHRATADVLKQRLLARMQHSGEPPATIANAEPRKSGQRLVTPEEANA